MSSTRPDPTFTCAACQVRILHPPLFHVGVAFCCPGCVADGPCTCSYDDDVSPDPGRPARPATMAPSPRAEGPAGWPARRRDRAGREEDEVLAATR